MLYNEERKLRFIKEKLEQTVVSENFLINIFKLSADMEKELNTDLCNFSTYNIIELYKRINTSSFNYLSVVNSSYSMYTQWCAQHHLVEDGQNHYLEISVEIRIQCINKALLDMKIFSYEDIKDIVELLNDSRDRFVVLCLFEGIRGENYKEIFRMKPEDINFDTGEILLCTGRTVKVDEYFLSVASASIEETKLHRHDYGKFKSKTACDLTDEGFVYKRYHPRTPYFDEDDMRYTVSRLFAKIGNDLSLKRIFSATSVYNSGKIHYAKVMAKECNMKMLDFIKSKNADRLDEKFNYNTVSLSFYKKYQKYLE